MTKKRVPKGTLTKILELANLTPEEFRQAFLGLLLALTLACGPPSREG